LNIKSILINGSYFKLVIGNKNGSAPLVYIGIIYALRRKYIFYISGILPFFQFAEKNFSLLAL